MCGAQPNLPALRGHAVEARIYAENPVKNFLPSTGLLRHLRTPSAVEFSHESEGRVAAVRVDAGVAEGQAITEYYDPMIAKLMRKLTTSGQTCLNPSSKVVRSELCVASGILISITSNVIAIANTASLKRIILSS